MQVSPSAREDGICSSTIPSSDSSHPASCLRILQALKTGRGGKSPLPWQWQKTHPHLLSGHVCEHVCAMLLSWGLERAFYSKQASNHQGSSAILKCRILADSCNCYSSNNKRGLGTRRKCDVSSADRLLASRGTGMMWRGGFSFAQLFPIANDLWLTASIWRCCTPTSPFWKRQ